MAEFRIDVVVDPSNAERGSRRVNNALRTTENRADSLRNAIARAFTFVAVAAAVRELVRLADTFTLIQNRLRTVTQGTGQLVLVTEELFQAAQRTRSSFQATAELFTRTALATRELGISQQQTIEFTESLNQAIILSGAGAREAEAGLIQLSQGLASGALRGDELRSVLEQIPVVADVIADRLNITRGELRAFGAEGRITADVVVNAFSDAREELAERFGQIIPTVGQAFTVFRNSLIQTVASLDETTGASAGLAQGILFLANNMETLLRIIGTVATALIIDFARRGVGAAIVAVRTLSAAILANPIGAIATAITLAVGALVSFGDQITISSDSLVTIQDLGIATFEVLGDAVDDFITFFNENFGEIGVFVQGVFQGIEFSFETFLRFGATVIDRFLGLWRGVFNAIVAIGRGLGPALSEIFVDAINGIIGIVESGINAVTSPLNRLLELADVDPVGQLQLGRLENENEGAGQRLGQALGDGFIEGFSTSVATDALETVLSRASEIADRRRAQADAERRREAAERARLATAAPRVDRGVRADVQQIIDNLEREGELLRLTNREREIQNVVVQTEISLKRVLSDVERTSLVATLRTNQALSDQAQLYDDIRSPLEDYNRTLDAANALLEQGRISLSEYNLALSTTDLSLGIAEIQSQLLENGRFEIQQLETQLEQRQTLIDQALEARFISEQEANELSIALQRETSLEIQRIEGERFRNQLAAGQQTFSALSQITRSFAGEQSSTYRTLFAISKAFTIADSGIQIANALAKAANTPFPGNLAAIATVASQTANIISTIQGTQFAGSFQNGGEFSVGGSGGIDSQLVSFRATPGERVSVQTPQQQRTEDGNTGNNRGQNEGGIRIVNVVDPAMVEDFLTTPTGERTLLNVIQRNAGSINTVLSSGG